MNGMAVGDADGRIEMGRMGRQLCDGIGACNRFAWSLCFGGRMEILFRNYGDCIVIMMVE